MLGHLCFTQWGTTKEEPYDQVTMLAKCPEGLDEWRMHWKLGGSVIQTLSKQEAVISVLSEK